MMKILLCCGGGFSSSAMAEHLKKDIENSDYYRDKMTVEFYPFHNAFEKLDEVDVIMCCPHLAYSVPKFIKNYNVQIPIYILPPKLYGSMTAKSIYEDLSEVIEGYKQDGRNPWCFPGEERNLQIKRRCSHREWMESQK